MSAMNFLLYLVAGFFYLIGCFYILAVFVAQTIIGMTIYPSDYVGIGLWIILSFFCGTFLIWYARRRTKREREKHPTASIEQIIPATDSKEAVSFSKSSIDAAEKSSRGTPPPLIHHKEPLVTSDDSLDIDELQLQYTLGEISKEEYEQKKQEREKK